MDTTPTDEFLSLEPMRVRRDSIQSTIADYLAYETQKTEPADSSKSAVNEFLCMPGPSRANDQVTFEYDELLERFMRNEIGYDEFMQMTGGLDSVEEAVDYDEDLDDPTISEPNAQYTTLNDVSENFVDEDDQGAPTEDEDEDFFDRPSTSSVKKQANISEKEKASEDIDDDRLLGIPLALRNSDAQLEQFIERELGAKKRMKSNKTIDGLIGHANVVYAKGNTKEAIILLLEAIRQEPRNSEPYRQVCDIYNDMNRPEKALQYGLLAAHLNGVRTSSIEWSDLGEHAFKLKKFEEAAACYGRAIRLDSTNPLYYERRIEALENIHLFILSMKTRLTAAQCVNSSQLDFQWFKDMITTAANYYIKVNDEEKAISALEIYVLRSREYDRDATIQHITVVRLLMNSHRYEDAAKSIFALCPGITAVDEQGNFAIEIKYDYGSYTVKPFPPEKVHRFIVGETLPPIFLARLIVCFIRMGRKDLAPTLVDKLFECPILENDEQIYLDIARAYHAVDCVAHAQKYIEHLLARPFFQTCAESWFLYGLYLSIRKKLVEACDSYRKTLDLHPIHVDARIKYATILQRLGKVDEAFEILREYVLDAGSTIPDERLLIRQADFLFDRKRLDEFARCVRMMLAPHFYQIYRNNMAVLKKRSTTAPVVLSHGLRLKAYNAIRGSALEKYVKRVGHLSELEERAASEMNCTQLHDYCFKLLDTLMSQKRYSDALHVCCYSYLLPMICKNHKTLETFQNLLFFCSVKAEVWALAFEYVRWFYTVSVNNHPLLLPADRDLLFTRIFNAMNFVFCHSQNISYHRYIMRTLSRSFGEYLRVWQEMPEDPLVCMLVGLSFIHIACKKDVASRRMIALRGIAFMNRYQKFRGECQETHYNIGRLFHQLNMLPIAIYFYKKCLEAPIPEVVVYEEGNDEGRVVDATHYDLRQFAAHNLACIYQSSGNWQAARNLFETYCVVE